MEADQKPPPFGVSGIGIACSQQSVAYQKHDAGKGDWHKNRHP